MPIGGFSLVDKGAFFSDMGKMIWEKEVGFGNVELRPRVGIKSLTVYLRLEALISGEVGFRGFGVMDNGKYFPPQPNLQLRA
jgi:hypothetical protein